MQGASRQRPASLKHVETHGRRFNRRMKRALFQHEVRLRGRGGTCVFRIECSSGVLLIPRGDPVPAPCSQGGAPAERDARRGTSSPPPPPLPEVGDGTWCSLPR